MNSEAPQNNESTWFGPALFTAVLIAICVVFWAVLF
jgi:hypothetical protein